MSINKVILVGNVGQDPKVRELPDGRQVASLSVATSRKVKGVDHTEWHNLSAFDKCADIVSQYVRKGAMVYIEGRAQTRKYTAADGTPKETREVIVGHIQILSKARAAEQQYEGLPKDEDEDDVPF